MQTRINPGDKFIDHVNREPWINDNLRLATAAQNTVNSSKRKDRIYTSKYKGVSWSKAARKWIVQFQVNGKSIYLGSFADEKDAARAYNKAIVNQWGEYAFVNDISD